MSNPTLLRDASVAYHLQLIQPWLAAPDVQEICVNRPAELWCERKGQWERHAVEGLSLAHLHGLAKAVARYNDRDVSFETPLLAGNLPQGERIQIVVPPACEQGRLSLTVRKPAATRWGLPELAAQGMFDAAASRHETDEALRRLYARQDVPGFLRLAVRLGKVIVVAGQTGAGKTTLMNALAAEIPAGERIVTIEDVREIRLDDHPNHVHLLHGTAAGRTLPVSELVRAALRMSRRACCCRSCAARRLLISCAPAPRATRRPDDLPCRFRRLGLRPPGSDVLAASGQPRAALSGDTAFAGQCHRCRGASGQRTGQSPPHDGHLVRRPPQVRGAGAGTPRSSPSCFRLAQMAGAKLMASWLSARLAASYSPGYCTRSTPGCGGQACR